MTAEPLAAQPSAALDVRVFDSPGAPADPIALAHLRESVAGADLAAPPVVLPDFHHKGNMEMPSSIAVATRGTIRPTLTSASVNCGMALLALDVERPGRAAITDFYTRVRERYPFPTTYRRDLTVREVLRAASEGGGFAVQRFGVDPDDLDRVEHHGRLEIEDLGGAERLRRELPWSVRQLSRIRFGTIGPSNHFIELQEVEEVLDPGAAEALGLELGQVTLQYHGGGGSLPGEVGMLYGRRKRYPKPVRVQMAVQKPLHHLASARSLEELRLRRSLYFSGGCPPIERDSPEGERVMLANRAAMNYGFAFRLSTYASLRRMLAAAFGSAGPRLVVDSPHNSIYEEEVEGDRALVHRHNACRAFGPSRMGSHRVFARTGQALLLPGTNRTSSYVCVATEESDRSLSSSCHGAGSMVKQFLGDGRTRPDPRGRVTLRYGYAGEEPVEVPQLDDGGVDEALSILSGAGIVRPVVRLRPFAVLT
jgi:tRNA-splicing ligase RtcB